MGPEINNSIISGSNRKLSNEQLGFTPINYNSQKNNFKRKIIIFGGVVLVFIILIILLINLFFGQKKIGSGDTKDFTAFIKLYQYGDENEKKEVNLNLPANYTYAYNILSGTSTSDEKYGYAEKLKKQYLKYGDKEPINSFLMLFTDYLEFTENISKIRSAFIQDEQSSKDLISKYLSKIKKTELEYINSNLNNISEYYSRYIDYLSLVKKSGCIDGQGFNINCEVDARRNFEQHSDLYNLYMEMDGLENSIYNNFKNTTIYLNNAIIATYKTKSIAKEEKK